MEQERKTSQAAHVLEIKDQEDLIVSSLKLAGSNQTKSGLAWSGGDWTGRSGGSQAQPRAAGRQGVTKHQLGDQLGTLDAASRSEQLDQLTGLTRLDWT